MGKEQIARNDSDCAQLLHPFIDLCGEEGRLTSRGFCETWRWQKWATLPLGSGTPRSAHPLRRCIIVPVAGVQTVREDHCLES